MTKKKISLIWCNFDAISGVYVWISVILHRSIKILYYVQVQLRRIERMEENGDHGWDDKWRVKEEGNCKSQYWQHVSSKINKQCLCWYIEIGHSNERFWTKTMWYNWLCLILKLLQIVPLAVRTSSIHPLIKMVTALLRPGQHHRHN